MAIKLDEIQAVISDMDGVLWHGDQPMPGLTSFFRFLQRRALPFVIATNNTTAPAERYQQKLADLGVTVALDNILTAALATAAYLQQNFAPGSTVYVIGQESLKQALRQAGFSLRPDARQPVELVVVGGDPDLTYAKLKDATLLLQQGANFIGTNPDLLCPSEEGLVPEAGTTLAALAAATGRQPTVIGKPEPHLFEMAVTRLGSRPEQTVMLGDRLETDILGGQRAGLQTILIATGVDNEASIAEKGIRPDATFANLEALTRAWEAQGVNDA